MRTGADTLVTGICVTSAIDMGNDVCPCSLLPHVHRPSESAPPSLWMTCQGILRMGCLWFLCSYTFFPTLPWSHLPLPLGVNGTASSFADRKLHAYDSCLQEPSLSCGGSFLWISGTISIRKWPRMLCTFFRRSPTHCGHASGSLADSYTS
jgi:hypothetical protein